MLAVTACSGVTPVARPPATRTAVSVMTTGVAPASPVLDDRLGGARDAVAAAVQQAVVDHDLQAAIVRVTVDGRDVWTGAVGTSMTGVPATTDMHFRNGAVAFSYIGTLLAILAGRGELDLDGTLDRWLPGLPHADRITVRMLATMTSGYADYVYRPEVLDGTDADPFRQWTDDELIAIGTSQPLMFEPGTNWGYSYTNYLILGQVITRITGEPLDVVMDEEILGPLGLRNTSSADTAQIPPPVLHSYTSERRAFLGVPAGTPFTEDATYWNPSWTTATGAVQSTDIVDLAATAEAIGSGALVTPALLAEQVGKRLVGVGERTPQCPVCGPLTADRTYGMGVLLLGDWIAQSKNFAGEGGAMAYLPSERIAIALVTTLTPDAWDEQGVAGDPSLPVLRAIAAAVAPDHPLGPG
nr:serine hydrolase domain-containing protein [Nakamurella flavida]